MKANMGNLDRIIRLIAGIVLIILAVMGIFTPWGWIGVVFAVTGLFKFCPFYAIFGINTCPIEKK